MIDMSGRTKITLLNALLSLLVHSVLCFILIPRYGVLGAALARLASVFLLRTARLIQVYVIWKMYPFRADFFKPLMAGAVSWLGLTLMKNTVANIFPPISALLSGILLFLGIYSAAVLLMGIPQEDRKIWELAKKKLRGRNGIR
jgi:O-antigen/teichoic acid export membrane protein